MGLQGRMKAVEVEIISANDDLAAETVACKKYVATFGVYTISLMPIIF